MSDEVDAPPHYRTPDGEEVIAFTQHLSFCRGSAVKYCWRAGKKLRDGDTPETAALRDLKKARRMIDYEIALVERQLQGQTRG